MNTTTREYRVGDLSNGVFSVFEDGVTALNALGEAIRDGIYVNLDCMGKEGCLWATEEEAIKDAEEFFFVQVVDVTRDEDGDIVDENYVREYQW